MSSEDRSAMQPSAAGAFSAAELRRRMAEREAAKAAEELRRMQAQEEQQKAVMAEFHKPPERTAEQLLQLVMQLVQLLRVGIVAHWRRLVIGLEGRLDLVGLIGEVEHHRAIFVRMRAVEPR